MTVLGISFGTRRNGVAVLSGTELFAAQVHSICGKWSPKKRDAFIGIFRRYIRHYQISKVIIKVPKKFHFTLGLKQLIAALDSYVKSQGCLIAYTTIEQIKK